MSCKVITIFSNKGGVGCTFIAVNTAAALAIRAKKVLLLDLDLQAGQDMSRMINTAASHSLVDVLAEIGKDEQTDIFRKFITKHASE